MSLPAALLLLALSAPPPSAERLDALDFDNGAQLVERSPSFSTGVGGWTAWALSDGDDAVGWCSPEGKPLGASYVWELDGTWRLDALGLSTVNAQESGYPGISAKTVELLVAAAQGPYRSLGKFSVGKLERREQKLPPGTQAARVKLVIVANHGHAAFTELSEVDLFGARVAPGPAVKVEGAFQTNYGPLRFVQEGSEVYGCYDFVDGARGGGSLSGRVARVTWQEPQGEATSQGTATFSLSASGDRIEGVWYRGGSLAGEWSGPKLPEGQGPRCVPRRKGQVTQALQGQGRVVLYGIRFDTGSDVPRPESEGPLTELLSTLQAQPGWRVAVEGHTDAVASDQLNLELSARRARSVVAWLVKRGIAPDRLEAKGLGRTRPVADNASAQGRALNRRVEVAVLR